MKKVFFLILLSLVSCQKDVSKNEAGEGKLLAIQPYGDFPKAKMDSISEFISSFYKMKTVILPQKSLYKSAFIDSKSPRYRADSIILFQKRELNDAVDFIIGLTSKDISTTKRDANGRVKSPAYKYQDWGIMGLGYCPGKSCVVSTFRLKSDNKTLHLERLKKVVIHEIGHNLGLPHCSDKSCVMTDAVESIATIDHARLDLCDSCRKRLQ